MSQQLRVIGDLSGYAAPFLATLETLGVDLKTNRLPKNMVIVQLGDLVHKGPDSDSIVARVDELMSANSGSWIQLIGNHEAAHLGGPKILMRATAGSPVVDECDCSVKTIATNRRWAKNGEIGLAAAVKLEAGDEALITHAGLSRKAWERLGAPKTATEAARAINEQLLTHPERAFEAGAMLGQSRWSTPGVVWADPTTEVYNSWVDREVPFGQIHGHTTPYVWSLKKWVGLPDDLKDSAHADPRTRLTQVEIGGHVFVGTDPGFSKSFSGSRITPYAFDGQILSSPLGLTPGSVSLSPDL